MAATVLTKEIVASLGLPLVEDGRYSQALHDVITAYRAARRSGSANSKTKAEVALSGAKPWRQKGTGRARAGYKSSPVWVGGGVVFGPKPRSYRKTISKTIRRSALKKALSMKVLSGDVIRVDDFSVSRPKTKDFLQLISNIVGVGKVLVVGSSFNDATHLAARNLQNVQLQRSVDLNAEDVLKFRKLVVTSDALTDVVNRLKS